MPLLILLVESGRVLRFALLSLPASRPLFEPIGVGRAIALLPVVLLGELLLVILGKSQILASVLSATRAESLVYPITSPAKIPLAAARLLCCCLSDSASMATATSRKTAARSLA